MTRRPLSRDRRDQVDRVVAGILDDMVSGRWVAGRSHAALAEREGVSVERVRDWATEAGRTLRVLALVDRDELRARNQARLDALYALAVGKDDPDVRAAVSALAEQGKLLGLNAPEKHVVATAQSYAGLSNAEMVDKVDAQIAELQELRQRLLMKGAVLALPGGDEE